MGIDRIPNTNKSTFLSLLHPFYIKYMVYNPSVRKYFGPGNIIKFEKDTSGYTEFGGFLKDLNNEISVNPAYKENMKSLDKVVSLAFKQESYLTPAESMHFGYHNLGKVSINLKSKLNKTTHSHTPEYTLTKTS